MGGVVQAGWGLLQMNLGFGLIVGSGFAEGLSGGTLTPLAILGAVGGGMLALYGSGDLWAGMQTAWDGKPHENMANTLARDVAKSLGANDPDWWANSFDAASVGLAWVAPAVQPRPEFPKLYPESPGPKPVKPPADKWSRAPESLQDQMTLDAARKGAGRKIIDNLGDEQFKGMEKWEYKVKSADGLDSVVHYVRDPKTGELMDFKFKKHSTDMPGDWGRTR